MLMYEILVAGAEDTCKFQPSAQLLHRYIYIYIYWVTNI